MDLQLLVTKCIFKEITVMMKRIVNLWIVISCLFAIPSFAQNITIKSVSLQPSDKTAVIQPCLDNNGDTCALLKIKTDNLEGLKFSNPNQYIKTSYNEGIYSVYLPELSRKLDFQHKDYMPIQLNMADYGFRKLRKGKTYLVVLDAPKKADLKSSIILKIEPQTASVTFDKKVLESSENGTYEIPVTAGTYSYIVTDENYLLKEGSISVKNTEVKTISIRLTPITHKVHVVCNVDDARVFIDNIDYGQVGKIIIPQGEHIIRVQAEGYVDSERNVQINSSTKSISFDLKENKRVTHIHATPVTIYSKSSSIYKNNKKIKEWKNGATIKFMPGKYLLSDDKGRTREIIVGDKPMEVLM